MSKAVPVTAVNSYYNASTGEFLLLRGDENGEIVVYDISIILKRLPDMVPVDVINDDKKKRRNPLREIKMDDKDDKKDSSKDKDAKKGAESEEQEEGEDESIKNLQPWVEEKDIVKTITNEKVHFDVIRSI